MRRSCSLLVLAVLGGCITPSIPIPPPDPRQMTFAIKLEGQDSTATFAYPANINYVDSIVFVFNRDRGSGVIQQARSDGSVGPTAPIAAAVGEQIIVSFQREDQTASTCVRLREGAQNANDFCD
jgi:hypothetical protein